MIEIKHEGFRYEYDEDSFKLYWLHSDVSTVVEYNVSQSEVIGYILKHSEEVTNRKEDLQTDMRSIDAILCYIQDNVPPSDEMQEVVTELEDRCKMLKIKFEDI